MEKLRFITKEGVCVLTVEWEYENAEFDSDGWLEAYGPHIGRKSVPLPNGTGWVDLRNFATVSKT